MRTILLAATHGVLLVGCHPEWKRWNDTGTAVLCGPGLTEVDGECVLEGTDDVPENGETDDGEGDTSDMDDGGAGVGGESGSTNATTAGEETGLEDDSVSEEDTGGSGPVGDTGGDGDDEPSADTSVPPIIEDTGGLATEDTSTTPEPSTCEDGLVSEVDWLELGPHSVGWAMRVGESIRGDIRLVRDTIAFYPAMRPGEDAAPDVTSGPHPVVFFQHAGGSHYTNYRTLFTHLASHGIVVVSTDHTDLNASVSWGSTDFWDGHDVLFHDTIDEYLAWSATPDHTYSGLLDPERMGLAGHSHGAVLRTMQELAPMLPTSEHRVQAVSLLAPCPDEAITDYLDVYGGMQPLQVVYGSRDQDGCVAWGQSIAIIEAGGAPSHFVHLDGGSHYGFTDEGGLRDATITRADHQDMAAASWLAWWKYHLENDARALPYLRGDRSLVPEGPAFRSQFVEADPVQIDGFTPEDTPTAEPTWMEVPAIVGIDGQTYVNGFLSDTFVDLDAGVALLDGQIDDLLADVPDDADPKNVLFFVDAALGTEAYFIALHALDTEGRIALTQATSHSEFAGLLTAGTWDLVVTAIQTGSARDEHPSDAPMADYICDGGRAIVSDYRMDSAGARDILACSLTGFEGTTNYETITGTGSLFDGTIDLFNPGWGFFTVGLTSEPGVTVFAHTMVEGPPVIEAAPNALGFMAESAGLDRVQVGWMHDESRGLYHPNWGIELAWSAEGAWFRQTLSDTTGFDASTHPVLSFRILPIEGDALNPPATAHDFHIRMTDMDENWADVPLSAAPQGALRPNPAVGAGTPAKAVYETYRLPLAAFEAITPALDMARLQHIEWRFDGNPTGALVLDDIVFSTDTPCE